MNQPQPVDIHKLIVELLTELGLLPSKSPLGVPNAGSRRLNRGFCVLPVGGSVIGGRGQQDEYGYRWRENYTVQLGHEIPVKEGQHAFYQSTYDDTRIVIARFAQQLPSAHIISSTRHTVQAAGQYLLTEISVSVDLNLDLTRLVALPEAT